MDAPNADLSPSSRRAWIEIYTLHPLLLGALVALLAEGVDRNYLVIDRNAKGQRRPPRGGRG